MSELNPLPGSISHKQLNALMAAAKKDRQSVSSECEEFSKEKKAFEELLLNWSSLSEEVLRVLSKHPKFLSQDRNANSLMALGALEVHLNMALQAKKTSEAE